MTYNVKEVFYSLQGEGVNSGKPAVFCRFTGCNLWSGNEVDRSQSICQFCDTDFVGIDGLGGGEFSTPIELVKHLRSFWPDPTTKAFLVCTGGEPLLNVDRELLDALHEDDWYVALETNGTIAVPSQFDWVCVSPKAGSEVVQQKGNELKLIYPQTGISPHDFEDWSFEHFLLQPLDSEDREKNKQLTLTYCLDNPRWRLSLQLHKQLHIR